MSADVLYGLSAAVGFGSADFLSRGVSHRIGFQSTLFYLQLIGGVGLLPLCLAFERSLWQSSDPWAFIAALSLLNLTGSLALYRAFEQGVVSVVAPVIAIVLAGTVSLSRSAGLVAGPEPRDSRAGLISAFVAMVALGLIAAGAKIAVTAVGPVSTIVILRLINVALVLLAVALGRVRLARPAPAVWPAVLTMTILDSAAFVAYTTGISVGSVALVSTLSGSFSAVTVALAALILRERLSRVAYASIGVMLAGVTLIVGV